jgi:hypothetical protein
MANAKPSLFSTVASGVGGFFKGLFTGGAIGALSGAAVGAVLAATSVIAVPVGAAALAAAAIGAATFGLIGSISGSATHIVKSREGQQVPLQDAVQATNVAFSQGVSVGHNMAVGKSDVSFRQREDQRRAMAAASEQAR